MDSSDRSPVQLDTLESLIQLFVNYLHTAKEPDTEGYSWVSDSSVEMSLTIYKTHFISTEADHVM